MEPVRMANFCRSLNSWPLDEAEASRIANGARTASGDFFVGAYFLNPGQLEKEPQIGVSISEAPASPEFRDNLEAILKDFVKRQVRHLDKSKEDYKTLPIPSGSTPWLEHLPVKQLSFFAIVGQVRGDLSKSQEKRRVFGWILIGSGDPLGMEKEVFFTSTAQRLSELAEIMQLELQLRMRSQFLSIASHELKTPLTSIYGILQLQERMLRVNKDEAPAVQLERQHSFVKMVIRQVERLTELIDGLLDVSRIQNNRFMVEQSETDVAKLLHETLDSRLRIIGQEAGVTIDVDAPNTLLAWVDPVRMEEVITNLTMNAIRFSPEGGVVWIRLKDDGTAFRLIVRDQGPNVPIEDRERIFQPFERAQRTARLGGLGLGLFISRQIAHLHGGNVSLVESVPGKGNVFEAYFPVRDVNLISA